MVKKKSRQPKKQLLHYESIAPDMLTLKKRKKLQNKEKSKCRNKLMPLIESNNV